MTKRLYVLFFFLVFLPLIHTDNQQRGLLVFLDDTERVLDAVSSDFLTAMSQKAGPIIASASLLGNVLSEYGSQRTENYDALVRKVSSSARRVAAGIEIGEEEKRDKQYLFIKASGFDHKDWIIKRINNFLYMLIPLKYLNSLGVNPDAVRAYSPSGISAVELRIGLKVNHMKTVDDIATILGRGSNFVDYFLGELGSFFCTRSDYHENKNRNIPVWSIFLSGHGDFRQKIVGLSLGNFREVLRFFTDRINIKLLVYVSCYAAGANTELIYKDAKSRVQKTYPFAIVTQANSDAPVAQVAPRVGYSSGRLTFETFTNFLGFLEAVTASEIIDYEKAVSNLFSLIPSGPMLFVERQPWGNLPQIKLPGLEWFSVMATRKEVVSIGSVLAMARDPEKPLDVVKFFKTDPKALLLYAKDVPFELRVDSRNMEAIISMIPGDAIHRIKKLSVKEETERVMDWFMAVRSLDPTKIFFIEELNNVQDVVIYNKKIAGRKGFSPTPDHYELYAFYSKGGKLYVKEHGQSGKPVGDIKDVLYRKLLARARGQIIQLGPFEFKGEFIRFSEISDSSNVESVVAEKADIEDVICNLRLAINSPEAIVWVRRIRGKYIPYTSFKIPGADKGDIVEIYDVVIKKSKLFFMHNGNFYDGKKQLDSDYRPEFRRLMLASREESGFSITTEGIKKISKILEKMASPAKKKLLEPKVLKQPFEEVEPVALEGEIAEKLVAAFRLRLDSQEIQSIISQHGIDVNSTINGETILVLAVTYTPDLVVWLISEKADVNAKSRDGITPLMAALFYRRPFKVIQSIINGGVDLNRDNKERLLFWATVNVYGDIVRWLISNDANVNAISETGEHMFIHALTSIPYNMPGAIRSYIEKGADVNVLDKFGVPALYYAIIKHKPEIVVLFLKAGADVNAMAHGRTLVSYVIQKGDIAMLQLFIKYGADLAKDSPPEPLMVSGEIKRFLRERYGKKLASILSKRFKVNSKAVKKKLRHRA